MTLIKIPFMVDDGAVSSTTTWSSSKVNSTTLPRIAESADSLKFKLAVPIGLTATPATTGGTMTSGTYYYAVTALRNSGETVVSTEASSITDGTSTTSSVALSWTAVTGATAYRVYKGTSSGTYGEYFEVTAASYTDTGSAGTAGSPPSTTSAYGIEVTSTTLSLVDSTTTGTATFSGPVYTNDVYPNRLFLTYDDWSGSGDGGQGIVNSSQASYQALMLVGNSSRGDNIRRVKVWDDFYANRRIHINSSDENTYMERGGGNSVRVQTNSGYVDIGPQNTSWSHFNTDRGKFYFGSPVYVAGEIYAGASYNQLVWNNGNDLFSASTNGYLRFPNGLTIQWGRVSGQGTAEPYHLTYPTAFSSYFAIYVTQYGADHGQYANMIGNYKSLSQAYVYNHEGRDFAWFAVGYKS